MVTTRRKITNERDRFGGYGVQPARRTSLADTEFDTPEETTDFSFSVTEDAYYTGDTATKYDLGDRSVFTERDTTVETEKEPVIEYSKRPYVGTYEYAKPTSAKKSRKRDKEDVMPSIRTRAYAENAQSGSFETHEAEKSKLSGKAKVALISYVAAVIVLAALVIITGLAISNINAESVSLENEISVKSMSLTELNAEINEYTNLDRISGAAMNNGMEKTGSVKEVDLLPTVDKTTYERTPNWFDRFCDFLSNIVGG